MCTSLVARVWRRIDAGDPGGDGVAADDGVGDAGRVERGGHLAEALLDALDGHDVWGEAHGGW
jgi:hypothetical protein